MPIKPKFLDNFFVATRGKTGRLLLFLPMTYGATANTPCCVGQRDTLRLKTRHRLFVEKTRRILSNNTDLLTFFSTSIKHAPLQVAERQSDVEIAQNSVWGVSGLSECLFSPPQDALLRKVATFFGKTPNRQRTFSADYFHFVKENAHKILKKVVYLQAIVCCRVAAQPSGRAKTDRLN